LTACELGAIVFRTESADASIEQFAANLCGATFYRPILLKSKPDFALSHVSQFGALLDLARRCPWFDGGSPHIEASISIMSGSFTSVELL
jgi:hypothetical protein